MDQTATIDRHATTLKSLLAIILVWIGLADNSSDAARMLASGQGDAAARAFAALSEPGTISRRVHHLVRRLLLPVEAATRRLIVTLAADLPTPKLCPSELARISQSRPKPVAKKLPLRRTHDSGFMVPAFLFAASAPQKTAPKPPKFMPRFQLVEPLKRFHRRRWVRQTSVPRVSVVAEGRRTPVKLPRLPTPYDQLPDQHLMRRVAALSNALGDLPRQAKRLALWRARVDAAAQGGHAAAGTVAGRSGPHRRTPPRTSPLRPGLPPGTPPMCLLSRDYLDEHIVLAETHSMAMNMPERRDSS